MTLGLLVLSERRDASFRDGLLPPTDSGRFVLFSLAYFWLRGGLAGSDGGTHLNAFLEYHRCHGDEGMFVQRSLTRGDKVGCEVASNLSESSRWSGSEIIAGLKKLSHMSGTHTRTHTCRVYLVMRSSLFVSSVA